MKTDSIRAVACIRFVRRLRVHWTSVEWLRECSIDEIEDGERWQRWETIFAIIKFGMPRRLGEPRFYKWRYDGRPRWNLSIGSTRIQWGCDHEDMYSPNVQAVPAAAGDSESTPTPCPPLGTSE